MSNTGRLEVDRAGEGPMLGLAVSAAPLCLTGMVGLAASCSNSTGADVPAKEHGTPCLSQFPQFGLVSSHFKKNLVLF